MAWYGIGLSWTIVLLPVVVLVHVTFTAAVALLLAMGNLFYRDVKYLFDIVLSVAMFATSVVYPVDRIGGVLGAGPGAQSDDPDHRRLPRRAPPRRRCRRPDRSSPPPSCQCSC